jgi:chondroitin AC lyase
VVCLGAGISSTQSEPVTTAVNQSWLSGNVEIASGGIVHTLGVNTAEAITSPEWVLHDSIGYFFPAGGNAVVSNQQQTGSWNKINKGQSSNTIAGNVFKLWFNHGDQPASGKYAYIVAPGISTSSDMQNYPVSNLKIIANSDSVQAVKNLQQHMMQIVFHKAGALTDDSITIRVDKPCVVLLKQLNTNRVSVHIADPAQLNTEIIISLVTPRISGKKYIAAQMPQAPYAGSTTRVIFDNNSPGFIVK